MKIRFKVDQRPALAAGRTRYSTIAVLQVVVKYDGFYDMHEATETIAERGFSSGRYSHHRIEEEIAEWTAKTIANLLRPLVSADDRPKDD